MSSFQNVAACMMLVYPTVLAQAFAKILLEQPKEITVIRAKEIDFFEFLWRLKTDHHHR